MSWNWGFESLRILRMETGRFLRNIVNDLRDYTESHIGKQ
jgi:hypothetical protein